MKKNLSTGFVAVLLVGLLATRAVSAFGGFGKGQSVERQAIQDALDANDYDAWVEAHETLGVNGPNYADVMTEEDFDTLVKMHQAKETYR